MNALLLSGYQQDPHARFALKTHKGKALIDFQIEQLQKIAQDIVVVVSGAASETILRHSQKLPECELVFDTSSEPTSLLSNLRAGVHYSPEWAVVLPVELPCHDVEIFNKLHKAYIQAGLLCPWDMLTGGPKDRIDLSFFPLLITRSGNNLLRTTQDLVDLEDPRLRINSIASSLTSV